MDAPDSVQAGQITDVKTQIVLCTPDVAPSTSLNCNTGLGSVFTLKTLTTPVDVTAGQRIDVTVTISFN